MRRISADKQKRLLAKAPVLPQIAISSREWILIGLVLALGIGLRLMALSRSALEHFDEGVYASNLYFGPPDFAYPQQRFFGPPLLPALIECGMIASLPPNLAALLPSFLAGCATIVALWWFGRSWFGPEVGISAAALIALSDFHVVYSATALTDVLLGLWLVLAIDSIARSLCFSDYRWAIGAGIYTGLAWWTKYNGWLPLAIEAAALPLLWLLLRPPSKQFWNWCGCFAVTAIVGIAVWSPYYHSLQSQGGYGPIAANHAKYFVGFAGWFDAAARQNSNQYVIESPFSKLAVILAFALPRFLVRQTFRDALSTLWQVVGVGVLALFFTAYFVAIVYAAIGCIRTFVEFDQATKLDEICRWRAIGLFTVIAWCGGLFVATPLYAPYPRLVLPGLLAAWMGMALNGASFLPANVPQGEWAIAQWKKTAAFFLFLLGACVWSGLCVPHINQPELPRNRRAMERIAKEILQSNAHGTSRVVYIYGEPALFFQLRAAGEEYVAPVQNVPNKPATVNEQPVPTFLIVGPHAESDPQFQEQWDAAKGQWELVREYDYLPSAVVWLDLHDPRKAVQTPADHSVRLFRFRH